LTLSVYFKSYKDAKSSLLSVCYLLCFFLLPATLYAQQNLTYNNGDITTNITFPGTGCSYKWTVDKLVGAAQTGTGTGIPSFKVINNSTTPIVANVRAVPLTNGFAYIANAVSDNVTVINAQTHAVISTISVGALPAGVAVSPDGAKVYVTNNNNRTIGLEIGSVSVIDAATNTVGATVTVGKNPVGIAVSPDGKNVYVANSTDNFVSIINTASNTVVREITGVSGALAIVASADGEKLFVAADGSSGGRFYIIQTSNGQILHTLPIPLKPAGIVATPDSKHVYITNSYSNQVSVINAETQVVSSIAVGNSPYGIAISPDGKTVYVANSDDASKSISIITTGNNVVSATISVPSHPFGVSVSPNGEELYISCGTPNGAFVMNTLNNVISPPIAVGLSPVFTGNFVSAGVGCSSFPVNFTVTVNPSPNIIADNAVTALSTVYGKASLSKKFDVVGNNLKAGILVTPPPGFEVSTDDITFANSLAVGAAGNTSATPVYIRLKAVAIAGDNYFGDVILTSLDANTATVSIPQSQVAKAQLTITADNKSRFFGDANPPFTVSYKGFVSGDSAITLTALPIITTTATKTSPLGKYPITAKGAVADNYAMDYVDGELEVIPGAVVAPTAFTPNDDGINDTWEVRYLNLYTNSTIEVINRYGNKVFRSVGYSSVWNGKQNGVNLPAGTYYYIINLNNNTKPITGYVSIIR
jgi:gliding motility-associated-like protein